MVRLSSARELARITNTISSGTGLSSLKKPSASSSGSGLSPFFVAELAVI